VGWEVGDAVAGEAGGDETYRDAQRELGARPGGPAPGDEVGQATGVGRGEFAGGEQMVVDGRSGSAEGGEGDHAERGAEEDGWPPAGAAPGDEAVGDETGDSRGGGEEQRGEEAEDQAGEVDEAVVTVRGVGSPTREGAGPAGQWSGPVRERVGVGGVGHGTSTSDSVGPSYGR
jgi:hypothetical protein